jgi:hypothetical protein
VCSHAALELAAVISITQTIGSLVVHAKRNTGPRGFVDEAPHLLLKISLEQELHRNGASFQGNLRVLIDVSKLPGGPYVLVTAVEVAGQRCNERELPALVLVGVRHACECGGNVA